MRFLLPAVPAALALISLTACLSSNVQVYGEIAPSEKTITVPPGSSLLVGEIKQRLQGLGWKLVVDRGPRRTVGTLGEKTDLATADTFHTRYRLVIAQQQFDYCILGGAAISYDLSLIDNATGEEVITQSGKDCQGRAVDKFLGAIAGKQS
jgi:hypothetical protein